MPEVDISVVITAHNEGMLAGISAKSALMAVRQANNMGLTTEVIVVLDRANSETSCVLDEAFQGNAVYLETDTGDPGLARNSGIEKASGTCSCFLDADDLWSENWLVESWRFILNHPRAIAHSCCNLVFGLQRHLWWHADSESELCSLGYMNWLNYWDALSFAKTEIYRQFPFEKNDLSVGFGHEDWYWNVVTLAASIPHKPVPNTMHFKRARVGSQMSRVEGMAGFRKPLPEKVGILR
jgi:glycosyltransferase involved in cell wall biosynthesis